MSDSIDDELRRAVSESEAEAIERPVVAERAPEPPRSRRELGLLAALLVIGGAILTLVFTSFDDAAIYSKGVDELVAEKDDLKGRNLRVQGTLVKGTLVRRDSPCEYRFKIEKNGKQVDVRYSQCVVPDTFRDVPEIDVDVTATGKIAGEGHFQATEIMAKCPSKYEMKQKALAGETMPHAAPALGEPAAPAVPGAAGLSPAPQSAY